MTEKNLLNDKKILIVDDEPDILESLEEILSMCRVVKATNFDEARTLLETQKFDMAILDIMGVDGYQLLEFARNRGVIAVMLTAHAYTPENTAKSFKEGAASFIPKEEMVNITTYLNDILEAKQEKKHFWWRWLERFSSKYDRQFGPDWKDRDKDFWMQLTLYSQR